MQYKKAIEAITSNFIDLLNNTVRPNLFYYNDGFPSCYGYWLKGSGFFIKYGNSYIYLTARHNFEKENIFKNYQSHQYNNLILLKSITKNQDIKFENTHVKIDNIFISSLNPDYSTQLGDFFSSDLTDISIVTLDQKLTRNIPFMSYRPVFSGIISNEKEDVKVSKKNDILLVAGHPHERNTYNFIEEDNKQYATLSLNRCYLIGKCISNQKGIGTIEIEHDGYVSDFNGFSGSPVFLYNFENNKYDLTGMIIRGTSLSKKVHYISIEFIYFYLMNTDIQTMRLEYDITQEKKKRIVKDLIKLNIGDIKHNKNKILINKGDETLSINFKYEYAIKPIFMLSKNKELINEKNLYVLQEIIVKSRFNNEIEEILYKIDYDTSKTKEIEMILLDSNYIEESTPLLNIYKVIEKLKLLI